MISMYSFVRTKGGERWTRNAFHRGSLRAMFKNMKEGEKFLGRRMGVGGSTEARPYRTDSENGEHPGLGSAVGMHTMT